MSPGSNKRQTGTVPKTKTSRKNAVPQEVVAPTRRDLQQHLNVSKLFFKSKSFDINIYKSYNVTEADHTAVDVDKNRMFFLDQNSVRFCNKKPHRFD